MLKAVFFYLIHKLQHSLGIKNRVAVDSMIIAADSNSDLFVVRYLVFYKFIACNF